MYQDSPISLNNTSIHTPRDISSLQEQEQPSEQKLYETGHEKINLENASLSVKDLPKSERPRERLTTSGAKSLSNLELLSILLGSGSEKRSSFGLSVEILNKLSDYDRQPLEVLRDVTARELQSIYGIGEAKAATIVAAIELGRRVFLSPNQHDQTIIDDPQKAAEVLAEDMMHQPNEKFAVLLLDIKHRVVGKKIVSSGTATETLAHPRDIFQDALKQGAIRIVIAHNHPSGKTEPSPEDIRLTRQLLEAGKILAVPVIDHIILGNGTFTSLRKETTLWKELPQGD